MNVFLFQNRFEADIVAGRKPHTIRGHRRDGKPRAKEGELVSLRMWTGSPYRSKQREIGRGKVETVFPIRINKDGVYRLSLLNGKIRPHWSSILDRKWIAKKDGFAHWREMKAWFKATHGLPFEGVLVHWRLLP